MADASGGIFSGLWWVARGKLPTEEFSEEEDMGGSGPQYIGGDPSQGRYNTTPPPGGEPPKSPSGHNWYTDEELAAWDAAGRPPNHDYLGGQQSGGGAWGGGRGFGR